MLIPKLRFKREDGTDYPEWEDWVLDSIGSFYGGLSGKTKEDFGKGNSKFVTYMNVYKNIFAMQEMLESVDISDNEKQNKVKYGDLLMTQSSETVEELGMSSVYLFYDEPYLNSFCFGLHLYNHALTYPMYIGYLMRSEAIRKQIMREGQGISRINLSPNRMKGMILSLPCLEEQQKIADFLSNVDEVIAQSEAEVANLQQQKKAAMQKIFSQEVRFKREDGTDYPEWNSKSFSDNFSSLNNNTFSRNMLSESGSVCNIHYGDIFVKYGEICDVQKENIPKVNDHIDTGKYDLLQDGDIILADTAEDETVGKATEILNVDTATVISGLHTMACRPNYKFAPMYLGYYINSPTYHNQLLPFMQGIKVTSIGRKNISETSISFPCLEEQQKIADFLATYDEAISYAKQELDKWKELKKGLLQQMFA